MASARSSSQQQHHQQQQRQQAHWTVVVTTTWPRASITQWTSTTTTTTERVSVERAFSTRRTSTRDEWRPKWTTTWTSGIGIECNIYSVNIARLYHRRCRYRHPIPLNSVVSSRIINAGVSRQLCIRDVAITPRKPCESSTRRLVSATRPSISHEPLDLIINNNNTTQQKSSTLSSFQMLLALINLKNLSIIEIAYWELNK